MNTILYRTIFNRYTMLSNDSRTRWFGVENQSLPIHSEMMSLEISVRKGIKNYPNLRFKSND